MSVTPQQAKRIVAANIDRRLETLGWSRYRLAQESGVSEQTISNICNEIHEPKTSVLATLASALGVTIGYLVADRPKESGKNLAATA